MTQQQKWDRRKGHRILYRAFMRGFADVACFQALIASYTTTSQYRWRSDLPLHYRQHVLRLNTVGAKIGHGSAFCWILLILLAFLDVVFFPPVHWLLWIAIGALLLSFCGFAIISSRYGEPPK